MLAKSLVAAALLVISWNSALSAAGEEAEQAFREGRTALSAGDLKAAFNSFAKAAKLDGQNATYRQQATLVRQVLLLSDRLPSEQDPARWALMAQAIRSFYVSHGLHDRALPLDRAMFDKQPTANNAIQLAETHMAMDHAAEASKVLAALSPDQTSAASQALLAIALVRQGKQAEAKAQQQKVTLLDDADPGTLYLAARMQSAVGDTDQALATLTRCFQAVSPSMLVGLKRHAQQCDDFAALNTTVQFINVLKTESQVPESKCSGGSSCSSCPMRGSCSHGQGQ